MRGGTGGKFSVPRKRKIQGERPTECACRLVAEQTRAQVDQKNVRLARVGADPKGRALRDFVVLEEDLGPRDENQISWRRSFREMQWWSEAEVRWRTKVAVCTAGLRDRALAAFGVAYGREEAERRGLPFRSTVAETAWGEPTGNEPGLECLSDSDAGSDDEEGPTRNDLVGWGLDEAQEKSRRE